MLLNILSQSRVITIPDFISQLNPLLWFKFDESTGTTADNAGSTGATNDATCGAGVLGNPPAYSPATYGALFNGGSDTCTFSATNTTFTTAKSIGVCFNAIGAPSVSTSELIYNEGDFSSSSNTGWFLAFTKSGGDISLSWLYRQDNNSLASISAVIGEDADYLGDHTAIAVMEGLDTGDTVYLYFDGVLVGSGDITGGVKDSASDRRIGNATANDEFTGTMNHFFYVDRELSASEAAYFQASFEAYG